MSAAHDVAEKQKGEKGRPHRETYINNLCIHTHINRFKLLNQLGGGLGGDSVLPPLRAVLQSTN